MLNKIKMLDICFNDLLKSDSVSKITGNDKPFVLDILPEEIGLNDLKVESPIFQYKNRTHQCGVKRINLRRKFNLNCDFNRLNEYEKKLVLNEMYPILKEMFTHIYKIIEKRSDLPIAGYVQNHIEYFCYGEKVEY